MAKIKYKPGGERRGFKRLGEGLRASESRIQEQRQIQIDSMKLAALRQEKLDNQFISGLSDKHRFEEGVLREKQELENKARTRKYEAFTKFADTDVARMEGEAKALKEKADFWKDFAPKFAANLGKLAQGAYLGQDKIRGQAQWKKLKESGILDTLTNNTAEQNFKLGTKANFEAWQVDPEAANTLQDKTWNISTHWASKRLAKWFKENKQLIKSDFEESFTAGTKLKIDEFNANDAYEFNAYLLLDSLGISPNSEGGREIMEMSGDWGREKTKQLVLNRRAVETTGRIEKAVADLNSIDIDENKGESFATGIDQYKAGLERLELSIKNGYFASESGQVKGPNDTLMSPADARDKAIEYIINNDKSLTYDKLNSILALDTADTGKNEKAVPYSQRHPLRAEALRDKWKERQKKLFNLSDAEQKARSNQENSKILSSYRNQEWKKELKDGQWVERETPINFNEWRLKKINEIANSPLLLDDHKNSLLSHPLINFNPDAIDVAGYYVVIKRDLMDPNGNGENAIATWGALSEKQKELLQQKTDIKIFVELNKLGEINGSGKGGFNGVSTSHLAKFKAIEGTNSLGVGKSISQSAEFAHAEMDRLWLQKYKELTSGEGGLPPQKALEQANTYIDELWKAGADGETGPFARTRSTEDLENNKWEFKAYQSSDKAKLSLVTANTDWSTLPNSEAVDYGVLKGDTVRSILSNTSDNVVNYEGDPKKILEHPRFINPKQLIEVKNQVENALKNKARYDNSGKQVSGIDISEADFAIPENVIIWADAHGATRVDVLNGLFEKHGFNFRIPADPQVAAAIKSDKFVPKKQNELGSNYFNSAKAQGILPVRKEIRSYLDSGKSTTDFFKEKTGISWEKLPDGSYRFSDSNGFLKNGGLDLPSGLTPQELINNLGISTGTTFLDSIRNERTRREFIQLRKERNNKENLNVTTM